MESKAMAPNLPNKKRRENGMPEHDAPDWMRITAGACQSDRGTSYYKSTASDPVQKVTREERGTRYRWTDGKQTIIVEDSKLLARLLDVSKATIYRAKARHYRVKGGIIDRVK